MDSLEAREIALELGSFAEGMNRKQGEEAGASIANSRAGRTVIDRSFAPLVDAILKEQEKVERGLRSRYGAALVALNAGQLALITMRAVLRGVAGTDAERPALTQTKLAREIGRACEDQYAFDSMEGKERDVTALWLKRVKKRWNALRAIREKAKLLRIRGNWPTFYLGAALLTLALRHSGWIERRRRHKKPTTIHLTKKARKSLDRLREVDAALVWPNLKPMILLPIPWRGFMGGGYRQVFFPLVKHQERPEVIAALEKADLRTTCAAVNALQETPWRVNERILDLMETDAARGRILAGRKEALLVDAAGSEAELGEDEEESEDPGKADGDTDRESAGKIQEAMRLVVARNFVAEKEIYFPYQLDWRGRGYALPALLHPQADDASRALLAFARGKPLGERGVYWLGVHLANLYGNGKDKLPFSGRLKWVQESREEILRAVERPFESKLLKEAEKPWRFLAASMEWIGFIRKGPDFVSHIPVAMDGTCNGLQHLSALGRDPEGGRWTNLTPGASPQDLYQEVADRTNALIKKHCGDEGTGPGSGFDQRALFWKGVLDRKYVKGPTMTTPYGVRGAGIRKQLMATMLEQDPERFRESRDRWAAADYLAPILEKVIAGVVVKAAEIMGWLREAVQVLGKRGLVASWTTPTGFPVINKYAKLVIKRIDTIAATMTLRVPDPKGKLDGPKQMDSIVPNLVHSLDAAHMMLTVRELREQGLGDFAMVHDSYAVHAADVDLMSRVLREQFIRVHEEFTLEGFAEGLRKIAPDTQIKASPAPGTLNLRDVARSEYFFS